MDKAAHHYEIDAAGEKTSVRALDGKRVVLGLTACGAALGLLALMPRPPSLLWNYTESVPVGLYRIEDKAPRRGDLVAVTPNTPMREALDEISALPPGRLLLKHVAATAGDTVCREGAGVTLNGRTIATARATTRTGAPLPVWRGCLRLAPDQMLLLGSHPASFDGRYLGPTSASLVVGVAQPLFTLTPEGAPS